MKTRDGTLYAVGGASRSGKTAWVRQAIAKGHKRLFAWDPEDQWSQEPGFRRLTRPADLTAAALTKGPVRIAYVPGGDLKDQFDHFAHCAFVSTVKTAPTDVIAEELADVTTPAKAPGYWGMLLRRGLKRGGNIYAISQRWQEADKTALGNAGVLVMFRQNGRLAGKYIADRTPIPAEAIPAEPLYWVRFDVATQKLSAGKLQF